MAAVAGRPDIHPDLTPSVVAGKLESAGPSARWGFEEAAFGDFLPRLHAESLRITPVPFQLPDLCRTGRSPDIQLKDAALFRKTYMKLVAGRTGRLMDYASRNDMRRILRRSAIGFSILSVVLSCSNCRPNPRTGKRVIRSPSTILRISACSASCWASACLNRFHATAGQHRCSRTP